MMCKRSLYHILSETPEFKRGRKQIADWHAECKRIRRADKAISRIQEYREILSWAKERAKRLMAASDPSSSAAT